VATDENELGIDFRRVKRVRQGSFATAFKWLGGKRSIEYPSARWYFERRKRMTMTRQDVVSVLGSIDGVTIAEIIASGASLEELREAWPGPLVMRR